MTTDISRPEADAQAASANPVVIPALHLELPGAGSDAAAGAERRLPGASPRFADNVYDPGPHTPRPSEVAVAQLQLKAAGSAAAEHTSLLAAWIGLFLLGLTLVTTMGLALSSEMTLYDKLLMDAREATRACPGVYIAYTMAIAPFRTFAWFRSATICLSFVLIFTGAAFVLSRVRAEFQLSGSAKDQGSVALSSPYAGVLMMTLGAILVGCALFRSASPSLQDASCENNPRWARGVGTTFVIDKDLPPLSTLRPVSPMASTLVSSEGPKLQVQEHP